MSKVENEELYQHFPLSSHRSIRVLTLRPSSTFTAPLEVSLLEISLDSSPFTTQYEALSYVWGYRVGDRPIICDGKTLLVTANCESAFRHLRNVERARNLWVDAVCIDQGKGEQSLRERSTQIPLMGEVYQKAIRTLCWLGKGTAFTAEVMNRLDSIGRCQSKRGLNKLLQFDESLFQKGLLNKGSSSLEHIFCHPWHSRIWTVQEVAFSKNCHILCGEATLAWDHYFKAAKFLIYDEYIDNLDIQATKSFVSMDIRNVLRNHILGLNDSTKKSIYESENSTSLLLSCLAQVRHLQATVPQDKVYGLYAAFSVLGVPLQPPDNNKTLERVYEESIVSMIVYTCSLGVLSRAISNNKTPGFPSWVPDWQDEDVTLVTPISYATEDSQVATTDVQKLVPTPGQLHVRGKIVGSVTTRSQGDFTKLEFPSGTQSKLLILTKEKYDFINEIEALRLVIHRLQSFREWRRLTKTAMPESDEQELRDTLYDILNFDKEASQQDLFDIWVDILDYPATKFDLMEGEKLAKQWRDSDSSNFWNVEMMNCAVIAASFMSQSIYKAGVAIPQTAALQSLLIDLASNMGDRALILVHDNGLRTTMLGTAFHAVKTDDVVVLLEGADFPVVLRTHGEFWRFIGPAFVEGIMDGEAWSDENDVVGELDDFVLI